MAEVSIVLRVDSRNLNSTLRALDNDFKSFSNNAEKSTSKISNSFKKLGSNILKVGASMAAIGIAGLALAGKEILSLTADFEKYNAVLANTFSSQEAATTALKGLQDFASKTPFSLNEITESYIKLVNRGIVPTEESLTSFGDFAAKSGKGLDQLSEAILDIGNQERWKEFGIRAEKAGDRLKLTFNGITKEAAYTEEGAASLIKEFGQMEGVAGGMEAISKTIGGQLSNLGDSFSQAAVAIGGELSPVLTPLIGQFSEFATNSIPFLVEGTKQLVDIFGTQLPAAFNNIVDSPLGAFLKENLMASFESIKQLIGSVISVVSNLWSGLQNLYNSSPLIQKFIGTIGKLIGTVRVLFSNVMTFFTGFANAVISFFTSNPIGVAIVEGIVEPLEFVLSKLTDFVGFIGDMFNELNDFLGFEKQTFEIPTIEAPEVSAKDAATTLTGEKPLSFDELQTLITTPTATSSGDGGTAKKTGGDGVSITGGGAKSITLNIENVVETLTVTQNQDPLVVKDMITRALISAVADVSAFA